MLIHGRLILTANGIMLDETRSLLQKSLRRKDVTLITQSANELLGYGKDQLPWKSITTFLFEDHCLSHVSVLEKLHRCFESKKKKRAIEILANSYTCRVAACLPVVSLDEEYKPDFMNTAPVEELPETERRLVASKPGQLNFDLICAHLKKAWLEKNYKRLISCLKLVSMMNDIEKVSLTSKGCQYIMQQPKKPNIGHVVMTILYNVTTDPYFKRYFKACFNLLSTPDVCVRLVLFAPVTHLKFYDLVKEVGDAPALPWKDTPKLTTMPHWAVDKHTFRGKFGKGVSHLVKKKTNPFETPEVSEEFYGERPKSDIETFFSVGCVCKKESMETNPFWERTKQIYFEQTKSKQKTVKMTQDYYKLLKKSHKIIFVASKSKSIKQEGDSSASSEVIQGASPRTRRSTLEEDTLKRKNESDDEGESRPRKKQKLSKESPGKTEQVTSKIARSSKETVNKSAESRPLKLENRAPFSSLGLRGPLLQLPTGSAKVYACVDLKARKVWKGPYRAHRLHLALFLHRAMKSLGDPHTLSIHNQDPFLIFPLFMGDGAPMQISEKAFYDAISKKSIPDGQFMDREALGIVQLHRLSPNTIHKLPVSIWVHFCYRFALNVGDSGIYNAITDKDMTAVYGIDLEEMRSSVKGSGFIDLIFTKRPNQALCQEISAMVKRDKALLQEKLAIDNIDVDSIQAIASELKVEFDRDQFCKRIKQLHAVSAKL